MQPFASTPAGRVPLGRRGIRRVPFTLALELGLLGLALALGLFHDGRGAELEARLGFGWSTLRAGELGKLFVSIVLVYDFEQWVRVALLCAWSVGGAELRIGTRRCVGIFAAGAFVSGLGTALIQGAAAGLGVASAFAHELDVGPSGGAFACAGALVAALPRPWRARALVAALVWVVGKPLVDLSPAADACHALAFPLGYALERVLGRGAARPGDPPGGEARG